MLIDYETLWGEPGQRRSEIRYHRTETVEVCPGCGGVGNIFIDGESGNCPVCAGTGIVNHEGHENEMY
jgi:DnaJ-class molecular chaperone